MRRLRFLDSGISYGSVDPKRRETRDVKRKQHSADFKAPVVIAALSGEKTLAELSSEFRVDPKLISTWKRASELFARGNKALAVEDAQKVIDDLHRKIGQLQIERDFLGGQPKRHPSWKSQEQHSAFFHLAHSSAAVHKLNGTAAASRIEFDSSRRETFSRRPT